MESSGGAVDGGFPASPDAVAPPAPPLLAETLRHVYEAKIVGQGTECPTPVVAVWPPAGLGNMMPRADTGARVDGSGEST